MGLGALKPCARARARARACARERARAPARAREHFEALKPRRIGVDVASTSLSSFGFHECRSQLIKELKGGLSSRVLPLFFTYLCHFQFGFVSFTLSQCCKNIVRPLPSVSQCIMDACMLTKQKTNHYQKPKCNQKIKSKCKCERCQILSLYIRQTLIGNITKNAILLSRKEGQFFSQIFENWPGQAQPG